MQSKNLSAMIIANRFLFHKTDLQGHNHCSGSSMIRNFRRPIRSSAFICGLMMHTARSLWIWGIIWRRREHLLFYFRPQKKIRVSGVYWRARILQSSCGVSRQSPATQRRSIVPDLRKLFEKADRQSSIHRHPRCIMHMRNSHLIRIEFFPVDPQAKRRIWDIIDLFSIYRVISVL